jgi:hypothetical protein
MPWVSKARQHGGLTGREKGVSETELSFRPKTLTPGPSPKGEGRTATMSSPCSPLPWERGRG